MKSDAFFEFLKKMGRSGWPKRDRNCSSADIPISSCEKDISSHKMRTFSESKTFFGNCHLSVPLIKSWDRMAVYE